MDSIKYRESQAIADEVNAWLAQGNTIKTMKTTLLVAHDNKLERRAKQQAQQFELMINKIYAFFKKHDTATTTDIAEFLKVNSANVHRYLRSMSQRDLLDVSIEKNSDTGRLRNVYRLVNKDEVAR